MSGPAASERPAVPPALVLTVSVLTIGWAAPLVHFSAAPALAISFWRLASSVFLTAGVLTASGERGALRRLSRGDLATAALAGASWPATSPRGSPPSR